MFPTRESAGDFLSYALRHVIFQFHADTQTGAPGADCLQKAGVEFTVSAPFHFTSTNT